jgi:DNA-nicking Smr family endonuclease
LHFDVMGDPIHVPIEAEIDLHAFSPRDISSVVAEYVSAAAAAGLHEVRIVHGRGRGIQRGMVQAALDRHPQVAEFWDDPSAHLGATFAQLTLYRPPKNL